MNRKISIGLAVSLIIISATASFAITMTISQHIYNSLITDLPQRAAMYSAVSELDDIIRSHYYGDINQDTLNANISKGYVSGLSDKSSYFMTAEEYSDYTDTIQGKLSGIGISVVQNTDNGFIHITEVFPGSPSESEGLKKGDEIVKIEGEDVTADNYSKMAEKLEGKRLSTVTVTYRRSGKDTTVNIMMGYTAQTVSYKALGVNGYIKIYAFYKNTNEQLTKAIEELSDQGVENIIFDVRNTSQGTIEYAAQVLDTLVPTPTEGAIATAVDKNGKTIETFTSDANYVSMNMAVLINGKTAGPAELFACDLRDFKKAELFGGKTAGNGNMQQVFRLEDGSAVMLTVAKIHPYGNAVYDVDGITPDYLVALAKGQEINPELLEPQNDAQMQAALDKLQRDKK